MTSLIFDSNLLDQIFGPDSEGATPEARGQTSRREFVRSQILLAEASDAATGRRLSALEALRDFGFDILRRAVEEGQAPIVPGREEPATTLRERREALGLDRKSVARLSGLSEVVVERAETSGKLTDVHTLDRLAAHLALDERRLGLEGQASGDSNLAARFRQLARRTTGTTPLSSTARVRLAEAAWIIARQSELSARLGIIQSGLDGIVNNPDYGPPAHQVGFALARRTRELLGIDSSEPVQSVRELIEDVIHVPLVQTELGPALAGATLANGTARGIVVNLEGQNTNPWVRRMTLAHELGHLLWDPAQRLKSLLVDRYDAIESDPRDRPDPVEMRANAFAVAFLAPPSAIVTLAGQYDDWDVVVEISERFGISVSASHAHVQNVVGRSILRGERTPHASEKWRIAENYATDYFPIASTPSSRVGRFAWIVLRAQDEGLISLDTAATLLSTKPDMLLKHRAAILELVTPT